MQKQHVPWFLFVASCISVIGLTIFVQTDRQEIAALHETNATLSKNVDEAKAVAEKPVVSSDADYRILTVKNVSWNNQVYQFQHRCKTLSCDGENQLTLITPDNKKIMLESAVVPSGDDTAFSPIALRDVQLISPNGTVLIAFRSQDLGGNDGPMSIAPSNHFTDVFHLNDLNPTTSLHPLEHFYSYGKGDWNPSGTKAVFYPDTAIDCEDCSKIQSSLIGYDLVKDATNNDLTKEQAVYRFTNADYDHNRKQLQVKENGKFLPTWLTCVNPDIECDVSRPSKWIDDDTYITHLVETNGTVKEIQVKF